MEPPEKLWKQIDIGTLFSLLVPEDTTWSWNGEKGKLHVICEAPPFSLNIYIVHYLLGDDRIAECYQYLEHHVRDVIGPTNQTSVQEVSGETWAGYQAVTAIGKEQFKVNRCVVSLFDGLLIRIEFDTFRDLEESMVEIMEELVFKEIAE